MAVRKQQQTTFISDGSFAGTQPANRPAAARWPGQETVADRSQGVQLATMKALVRYCQTGRD
jgi:hypothetical protein